MIDGAPLTYQARAALAEPAGLLVLSHGRGSDEADLIGLADLLDPRRRLHVVAPRAPLQLPGSAGYHWYVVPRVGHPDHDTFHAAYAALGGFLDAAWEATGIGPERTVLSGFSMGSVMSYALGLGPGRPRVAGLLILSGFVPTVDGWQLDPAGREGMPAFVSHGRHDPVMGVDFARRAQALLAGAGIAVEYHETEAAHHVDPGLVEPARAWLERVLP